MGAPLAGRRTTRRDRAVTEFLAMGGHGAYVWSAYGVSALALAFAGIWPLAAMRSTVRRLRRNHAAARERSGAQREGQDR